MSHAYPSLAPGMTRRRSASKPSRPCSLLRDLISKTKRCTTVGATYSGIAHYHNSVTATGETSPEPSVPPTRWGRGSDRTTNRSRNEYRHATSLRLPFWHRPHPRRSADEGAGTRGVLRMTQVFYRYWCTSCCGSRDYDRQDQMPDHCPFCGEPKGQVAVANHRPREPLVDRRH